MENKYENKFIRFFLAETSLKKNSIHTIYVHCTSQNYTYSFKQFKFGQHFSVKIEFVIRKINSVINQLF